MGIEGGHVLISFELATLVLLFLEVLMEKALCHLLCWKTTWIRVIYIHF